MEIDMSKILDFLQLENSFTSEEKMIRDVTYDFVGDRVKPDIARHFEQGDFPLELVREMGELGFFGANLSEFGGSGISSVGYGLIMQELERGDSGVRSFASVQNSLVIYPIYTFGSQEQKDRYLPDLISGKSIGCFGLTEADHGSDPGGMKTKAVFKNGRWILNGSKMWITNGNIADVAVVWARTSDGIQGFIVDRDAKGYCTNEIKHKVSLRASVTSELVFEDVELPDEQRLVKNECIKAPLKCLSQARYGIGWGVIGAAMDCYHTALDYSRNRIQFDKPIASFQLIQEKLANMLTEITQAQLLAYHVGRLKDAGRASHVHISMLKRNNVNMALDITRDARAMLGANGTSLEYPIIRHMCNLEAVKTYEGTHDIHTLILGQQITGFQAFRAS